MKKLLLLSALSLTFLVGAQGSFEVYEMQNSSATLIPPNGSVFYTTSVGSTTNKSFNVRNASNFTKKAMIKRYDVVLNLGAEAYFCFAGSCYGSITTISQVGLSLLAGQSSSAIPGSFQMLITDMDEQIALGYSHIKYTVYDSLVPNDSTQFSIIYNNNLFVSVGEMNKSVSAFGIFPNPALDNTVIKLNASVGFNAKLSLYNALGEMVFEKQVPVSEGKNSLELDVANLPTGIYFVNIESNSATLTRKLIVK